MFGGKDIQNNFINLQGDNTTKKSECSDKAKQAKINRLFYKTRIMLYLTPALKHKLRFFAIKQHKSINYIFRTALKRFFLTELNYQKKQEYIQECNNLEAGLFFGDERLHEKTRCCVSLEKARVRWLTKTAQALHMSREQLLGKLIEKGIQKWEIENNV